MEFSSARALIHQGKLKEADSLLAQGGFVLRLADKVFNYQCAPAACGDCPVGRVFDHVLPVELVQRLVSFLADDGLFFTEHKYGPSSPYFSYAHDVKCNENTLIEQTADLLKQALVSTFPELSRARKIEWWAHSRHHESGHQLHWDTGLNLMV